MAFWLSSPWNRRRYLQFFIEVFSGSGTLSKALRNRGSLVIEWDISRGPSWDLTKQSAQRRVRGWLLAGIVWGIHMGTPCSTFSRARDTGPLKAVHSNAGFPSRLRSDTEPWGLAAVVNLADRHSIQVGNSLARFSFGLLALARRLQLPATMENPKGSRLWILPPARQASLWSEYCCIDTDFCQWGKPWKKGTRFIGVNIDLLPLARVCTGRSTCCRTGKPHQSLTGIDPATGRFWTAVAEPYPKALALSLAMAFEHSQGRSTARRLWLLLNPPSPP